MFSTNDETFRDDSTKFIQSVFFYLWFFVARLFKKNTESNTTIYPLFKELQVVFSH